jgi:cobalt-zinc-cadmium efflux system membrane fusion protein
MRALRFLPLLAGAGLLAGLAALAFFTRDRWMGWLTPATSATTTAEAPRVSMDDPKVLKLTPQARENLHLVSRPITLQPYWRTIEVPGVVVDRPGQSDREITAPAVGIVSKVHAFPGDTVKHGDPLFSLRLISEYLQNTQSELFKATREVQLVKEQKDRLKEGARSGAVSEAKIIELDNQLRRLHNALLAYRQDLLTRGLTPPQLDGIAEGTFVSEIQVLAPKPPAGAEQLVSTPAVDQSVERDSGPAYEVQELKVELGQQVQAGQTLALLANHQSLYIEGHGYKREAPLLAQAAQNAWLVRVEFAEEGGASWPPLDQTFQIRHLANAVDPVTRTFAFYLPLANQSRSYQKDGHTFLIWHFRPGQRVRLHVPVEEFKDAIVLPADAVLRKGPEAYVFRQNGDLFDRRPVHVLFEDRLHVVLANDGSISPGLYVAQSAAASLNRILEAQNSGGGLPPGFHVHADGTVHGAH